jgi:hypothetical protein
MLLTMVVYLYHKPFADGKVKTNLVHASRDRSVSVPIPICLPNLQMHIDLLLPMYRGALLRISFYILYFEAIKPLFRTIQIKAATIFKMLRTMLEDIRYRRIMAKIESSGAAARACRTRNLTIGINKLFMVCSQ